MYIYLTLFCPILFSSTDEEWFILPTKQKDNRYRTKVVVADGEKPVWISARTQRELEEKKRLVRETYIGGSAPRNVTFHAMVIEWFNVIKKPRSSLFPTSSILPSL